MLEFNNKDNRVQISIDGRLVGCITKEDGFICKADFVKISLENLEMITLKTKEVMIFGKTLPVCEVCGGTPYFPKKIYNPNEGESYCAMTIHLHLK